MQLVNVQSNTEFASHLLNRDTWGDPAFASIVAESFLFFQVSGQRQLAQNVQDGTNMNLRKKKKKSFSCTKLIGAASAAITKALQIMLVRVR